MQERYRRYIDERVCQLDPCHRQRCQFYLGRAAIGVEVGADPAQMDKHYAVFKSPRDTAPAAGATEELESLSSIVLLFRKCYLLPLTAFILALWIVM